MKTLIIILFLALSGCNLFQKEELPKTDIYKKMIGKWKVVNSSFLPFEHRSYCEKLSLNSIFNFDKYGTLKIYENQTSDENCNDIQSYWIECDKLIVFEYDVGFDYEILKLTKDSLILKTNNVPEYLYSEENKNTKSDLNSKEVKNIQENGIIITLTKKRCTTSVKRK